MHYQKKIKCNTWTKISLINYYVLSFFLILNSYFLLTSCSDSKKSVKAQTKIDLEKVDYIHIKNVIRN